MKTYNLKPLPLLPSKIQDYMNSLKPLYYSNAVPVSHKPHLSHIVSRIICHYFLNSCTSNDVIDILNLLLKTDTFMKLIKGKNQPKRCRDLSFLLNKEISCQTRSIINRPVKMEQITDKVSPARIATLDHENEKEGAKLRDLINNGLSSNIKKSNNAVVKKYTNFNKEN